MKTIYDLDVFFIIIIFVCSVPVTETSLTDWYTTDILVKIKPTHENNKLIYQTGVIKSISVSLT